MWCKKVFADTFVQWILFNKDTFCVPDAKGLILAPKNQCLYRDRMHNISHREDPFP